MALSPQFFVIFLAFVFISAVVWLGFVFRRGLYCSIPRRHKATQTLRVGFLHPDFGIGGSENLVVNAALALQQRGVLVTVFTAHHDINHCFDETRGDGPLSACVRVHGDFLPQRILGKLYAFCTVCRMLFVTLCVALWYIDDIDVFIVDQVSLPIPFLRAMNKPVLFYGHFPDKLQSCNSNSIVRRPYRFLLDTLEEITTTCSDVIVANSNFSRGVFLETFPRLQPTKLGVLYPPVDTEAYTPTGDNIVERDCGLFLSLNRFERKKSLVLAVQALSELRSMVSPEHFKDVKLILAGGYDPLSTENREHLNELRDEVSKLGLDQHVEFRTSVSNNTKIDLLRSARALLYTPDREHFGIVPVEAMACGTPVVAVRSGGPLETVVDGETGFLCDQTPKAFAEAMGKLYGPLKSGRAAEMGANGNTRANKHFSMEAFGTKLFDLVNQLAWKGETS